MKTSKTEEDQLPVKPSVTTHTLTAGKERFTYEANADWITLRKKQRALAKMFHVAYFRQGVKDLAARPVTFVFNGGPGAASAYLHMGAVGPKRVAFGNAGSVPPPPAKVVDNHETWLPFTDLVFIDPVGTGFSRSLDAPKKDGDKGGDSKPDDKENPEFWENDRDLESLGEFIRSFLSKHKRWSSPVFIAGESYGGYRVAKLARLVQERYGVGLNGAILISPAIEWATLMGTDYTLEAWLDHMPTQAAVAHAHGRCKAVKKGTQLEKILPDAEQFARNEMLQWLTLGDNLDPATTAKTAGKLSDWTGIPKDVLLRAGGRIKTEQFCRLLLRDEGKLAGFYDGSVTTIDPYPDRDTHEGPDPTLWSIDRLFGGSINHHLRSTLGIDTELDYRLLSMEVNEAWKFDKKGRGGIPGAMDDLRYGMSLNLNMKVFITHGYYDLVTPYYSSDRLVGLMKLPESERGRLTLKHFKGGHMFYSWDESREAFTDAMKAFYRDAVGE
ncbi:MAG: peptidase S10 [Planctomycetaceae bacterium]|nr:peptidase S10 [Planctomycetaceae bacterium]